MNYKNITNKTVPSNNDYLEQFYLLYGGFWAKPRV